MSVQYHEADATKLALMPTVKVILVNEGVFFFFLFCLCLPDVFIQFCCNTPLKNNKWILPAPDTAYLVFNFVSHLSCVFRWMSILFAVPCAYCVLDWQLSVTWMLPACNYTYLSLLLWSYCSYTSYLTMSTLCFKIATYCCLLLYINMLALRFKANQYSLYSDKCTYF